MVSFVIRPAVEADIPELLVILEKTHTSTGAHKLVSFDDSLEGYAQWVKTCILQGLCFVAAEGGKLGRILGLVEGVIMPVHWNTGVRVAHQTALWVEPDARGNGIAKALLSHFEGAVKEKNAPKLFLNSNQFGNPKAFGKTARTLGFHLVQKTYAKDLTQ